FVRGRGGRRAISHCPCLLRPHDAHAAPDVGNWLRTRAQRNQNTVRGCDRGWFVPIDATAAGCEVLNSPCVALGTCYVHYDVSARTIAGLKEESTWSIVSVGTCADVSGVKRWLSSLLWPC